MSNSSTNKWLIGCGVAAGIVILAVFGIVLTGYMFFQNTLEGLEEFQIVQKELINRHGRLDDFTPSADGSISPERVRTFLAVRQAMIPTRLEMEDLLNNFTKEINLMNEEDPSFFQVIGLVGDGAGMISSMFKYYQNRNEALLAEGMGLGEYSHIYVIGFYSYLGAQPEDGPNFQLTGNSTVKINGRSRSVWRGRSRSREGDEGTESQSRQESERKQRRRQIVAAIRAWCIPMLTRQLESIPETGSSETVLWRETLAREIAALEEDYTRLPWQNGLPANIAESLEPYKTELKQQYSFLLNAVEMQPMDGDWEEDWDVDFH